jgi:hypothetical protein
MTETIAVDLILFHKELLIKDAEMMRNWEETGLIVPVSETARKKKTEYIQTCTLDFRYEDLNLPRKREFQGKISEREEISKDFWEILTLLCQKYAKEGTRSKSKK